MSIKVQFNGKEYDCDTNRPLLFTMNEQGAMIPHSCQSGFCQVCLSKVVQGNVPESSQEGLSESIKAQGCFLPCICKPSTNLTIELATRDNITTEDKGISPFEHYTTMVIDKTWLNDDVLRLCLVRPEPLQYKSGQFINIIPDESLFTRSYSLASIPCENFIELHIKRIPHGKVSNWLCDDIQCGDHINISGPSGECCYQSEIPEKDIILAGVGTGLAPLFGILRDAIESNHRGNIYLFHASLDAKGLYYQEEVAQILKDTNHLTYIPCVLNGEAPQGGKLGAVDQIIVDTLGDCTGKRAYLCGDDAVVQTMKETLFQYGLSEDDILADAFTAST